MRQEAADPGLPAAENRRRRSSRVLATLLAASAVAHAAAVAWLPGFANEPAAPVRTSALEVTVMKPEPLPVAASTLEPAPAPKQGKPERTAARPDTRRDAGTTGPLLALAKPEPELMGSFSVAPARLPERVSPQPQQPPAPEAVIVTPPSFDAAYLGNPAPQYPSASRRAGEQGTVLLRVLVKRDGLPLRVEIEKSSGSAHLDAAARDAVWGWRFQPGRQGTDPIESWVGVPVVFRLEGSS